MINTILKDKILDVLKPHYPKKIGVFGSYARGENTPESDLDILVSFKEKIGLLKLVQIEQELSDVLGIRVDLLTENSLKNNRLKHYISKDLITIYH